MPVPELPAQLVPLLDKEHARTLFRKPQRRLHAGNTAAYDDNPFLHCNPFNRF